MLKIVVASDQIRTRMCQNWSQMEVFDIQMKLLELTDRLIESITLFIVVEEDSEFQDYLHNLVGSEDGQETLLWLSNSKAWLKLPRDEHGKPCVLRKPVQKHRVVDVCGLAENDLKFREVVRAKLLQPSYRHRALDLVSPIFNPKASLRGAQISQMLELAPLIEQAAYAYFANANVLLDDLRPLLLRAGELTAAQRRERFQEYWTLLHVMGHMLTIASTRGSAEWLSEMPTAFRARQWTPTYTLLRERTVWLLAPAARSAAAFGERVVEHYLAKLATADHPMRTLDALVGLAAVGIGQPGLARHLVAEIVRVGHSIVAGSALYPVHIASMLGNAIGLLRNPEAHEQQFAIHASPDGYLWRLGPESSAVTVNALRTDPTGGLKSGHSVAFAILPQVVRMDPVEYYPQRRSDLFLPASDVRKIVSRAWASTQDERRTLH